MSPDDDLETFSQNESHDDRVAEEDDLADDAADVDPCDGCGALSYYACRCDSAEHDDDFGVEED